MKSQEPCNKVRDLKFSSPRINAQLVQNVRHRFVPGRAIVINPSPEHAPINGDPTHGVPAMSSTTLVDTYVDHADSLIVIKADDSISADSIASEPTWLPYSEIERSFPCDIPLWKSASDRIGTVSFDPAEFIRASSSPGPTLFDINVNLWFSPPETSCLIHNQHHFIEVHTQILGNGRMQKFKTASDTSQYEDQPMAPGNTVAPFCGTGTGSTFSYPWHQYYSDTACVWMAIEYLPESSIDNPGRKTA